MERLKKIEVEDVENIHHLFNHQEVKRALMRIIGKPETDGDHKYIDEETKRTWKKLPKYIINREVHTEIHKKPSIPILETKDLLKKKVIEELVIGGIKCFEKDKGIKVEMKPSLIKRIVGQIYGYINNYDGIKQ